MRFMQCLREIGSEYWDIPIGKKENVLFGKDGFKDVKWYLSGRSALMAVIASASFESVSLPSWCCDSMIKPFADAGKRIKFYPALTEIRNIETDAVIVMDYFGFTGHSELHGYNGIVIRDLTHSVFSRTYNDADYYFGSLRKWAGFYTGGFAFSHHGIMTVENRNDEYVCDYISLREKAMKKKKLYICGESDDKDYLADFGKAEEFLDNYGIAAACHRDCEAAVMLDIEYIKRKRRENAKVLMKSLGSIAVFPEIGDDDCPMFVPVCVPDGKRDDLRRRLIQNAIYCPVHWPLSEYHQIDEEARKLYDNELSLICDHRYGVDDMKRIVDVVSDYI